MWLTDYDAWNYDAPGAVGIANPNPERVDGFSLEAQIEELRDESTNDLIVNYASSLQALSKAVTRVADKSSEVKAAQSCTFCESRKSMSTLSDSICLDTARQSKIFSKS